MNTPLLFKYRFISKQLQTPNMNMTPKKNDMTQKKKGYYHLLYNSPSHTNHLTPPPLTIYTLAHTL